jgi:hypothetical protein
VVGGPLWKNSKEPYKVSVVLCKITYYTGKFIRTLCSIGWSFMNISKKPYTLEMGPTEGQFIKTLNVGEWFTKYLTSTFWKIWRVVWCDIIHIVKTEDKKLWNTPNALTMK